LKLNVDASFIEETGQASTGAVVRNHQGHVLVSAWRVLFDCFSVEEAKFAACCEGLRLVSQRCHGDFAGCAGQQQVGTTASSAARHLEL